MENNTVGNPKYAYGDIVEFNLQGYGTLHGEINIIDAYGTFEQSEEPSYDVMVEDLNGQPCLVKHIRESDLTLIKRSDPQL